MSKSKLFYVEMTDTFGGESNYTWVERFIVRASTFRGAISKVSKETGYSFRIDYDAGDYARYNAKGACVCAFVRYADNEAELYSRIIDL